MSGWWIFVGALAGLLTVPRGIHGWYFWYHFTKPVIRVVMWVRGYQGPPWTLKLVTQSANLIRFSSIFTTFSALNHKSIQAAHWNIEGEWNLWPQLPSTLKIWNDFLLSRQQWTMKYPIFLKLRGASLNSLNDPFLGSPELVIVSQGKGQRLKFLPFQLQDFQSFKVVNFADKYSSSRELEFLLLLRKPLPYSD